MQVGEVASDIWPFGAIILFVLFVVLLAIMWRRKHSLSYLLCLFIFSVYLLFALDKVFFPLQISGNYVDAMRELPLLSQVNLIPFYFSPYGTFEGSLVTLLQNIVLTIPFGFGVNFVAHIRPKNFLWIAPAVGLGLEGTQLIITLILRYPYRVVDINDVLMNALGVWIGYGFFRVFAWLYLRLMPRLGIMQWGLVAYFYDVANHTRAVKDKDVAFTS